MPLLTQIYAANLLFPWLAHHNKVWHGPLQHLAWETTAGNTPELLEKLSIISDIWNWKPSFSWVSGFC